MKVQEKTGAAGQFDFYTKVNYPEEGGNTKSKVTITC